MTTEQNHNQPEYTVSEISHALKRTVEDAFGHVRVRGEISGFKQAASGHIYFNLKDENAVLNAVCWKGVAGRLPFAPEDGLEVIAAGKISTYPGRSNYQLIVDWMQPSGAGALMALLEKRRKQLAAEGLFDPARKKPLPVLPRVVGVVTSPTGAVIRDILHRFEERFPVHVLVWPVLVQGEQAAAQVAAAVRGFNTLPEGGTAPRPDVLIVARGGGSLEDLWPFNEEIAVRAVAESAIPVVTAVGHETDTTLVDYASDKRAPTPTAAAEMIVPVRSELQLLMIESRKRLLAALSRMVQEKRQFVQALARGLTHPRRLLENATQRLDDLAERLRGGLPRFLDSKRRELGVALAGLKPSHALRLADLKAQQLEGLARLLESYHYKKVLARGYALVWSEEGKLVTSSVSVTPGLTMQVEFKDGKADVIASGPGGKGKSRKSSVSDGGSQESLF